jgi:hypothetical protein
LVSAKIRTEKLGWKAIAATGASRGGTRANGRRVSALKTRVPPTSRAAIHCMSALTEMATTAPLESLSWGGGQSRRQGGVPLRQCWSCFDAKLNTDRPAALEGRPFAHPRCGQAPLSSRPKSRSKTPPPAPRRRRQDQCATLWGSPPQPAPLKRPSRPLTSSEYARHPSASAKTSAPAAGENAARKIKRPFFSLLERREEGGQHGGIDAEDVPWGKVC